MKNKITSLCVMGALLLALGGCGASTEMNTDSSNVSPITEVTGTVSEDNATGSIDDVSDESDLTDNGMNNDVTGDDADRPEFKIELADGTYMVDFDTDSSMFHVNEAMNGKARLTVKDSSAVLYLIMPSKNVLNLYAGMAENAEGDENHWISPVTELVTYDDGITEEVFAYYVPVYVMDEEFDLALVGKKNNWYDHKVSISNPEAIENDYVTVEIELEGGTGRSYIESPVKIRTTENGYTATLIWSSKYYDYMIVDDVKYLPIFVEEHSVFEIAVNDLNTPLNVIADTTAMSEPHEIEYVITFLEDTLY